MNPYFDDGRIRLYLGDCRTVLPRLALEPSESPVACVTDPPVSKWPAGWLTAVGDALPDDAILWAMLPTAALMSRWQDFQSAKWRLVREQVWAWPLRRDGLTMAGVHEWNRCFVRGRIRETYRGGLPEDFCQTEDELMRSVVFLEPESMPVLLCPRVGRADKPIAVAAPPIVDSVPPEAVVLDPFAGGGYVLTAAAMLGRRAIGIEADERVAERTARRLAQGLIPLPEDATTEPLFADA